MFSIHAVPPNPGIINTAILLSCFAGGANNFPEANEWAKTAAPFLLKINSADNGKQLTVPARGE
jgi:hypothetical protein